MNFADTNWLASVYIEPKAADAEAVRRRRIVERFLRQHGGPLAISHVVLFTRAALSTCRHAKNQIPISWNATFDNDRAYMLKLTAEANRRWNKAALLNNP